MKLSFKRYNINTDFNSFLSNKTLSQQQRYEQQLRNELEIHIELYKQCPGLVNEIAATIRELVGKNLKKSEKTFFEHFGHNINKYFLGELNNIKANDLSYGIWAAWFAEFFVDVYLDNQVRKKFLTYTTHEILNQVLSRFNSFNLFYNDDFRLSATEERVCRRIIIKILQVLVAANLVTKRLTYEYDQEVRSIYIYSFGTEAGLQLNLYHLKINLTAPSIFISNTTPYSKTLTYLGVNKIMLASEGNLQDFKLKDLNLLYKLFNTQYMLDIDYYRELRPHVVASTPVQVLEDLGGWR
ncbi:MAG: hypothetical protein ACK42D_04345 [Candidatus Paceibacteria bacterium]